MYFGKGFNDGADDDAPRFIPVGARPVDFIPVGKEDEYHKDSQGNYWTKEQWEKMRMK